MTDYIERKIIVDLWRTSFHGKEVGLKKKEEYMAKDTQFTKDTDIIGEVKEAKKSGEETIGYVTYRTSLWDEQKDKSRRRLVMKLFSKNMYYQGSLEELVTDELMHYFAWHKTYPSFVAILDNSPYVTKINKVRNSIFNNDWYSLDFVNKEGNYFPFLIKNKLGLGKDFRIHYLTDNKQVGTINSSIIDIGGQLTIKLKYTKELVKNNTFIRALILFAASVKFHDKIDGKIKKLSKTINKTKTNYIIERNELDMRRNPRTITKRMG